jgi:FdrA protein
MDKHGGVMDRNVLRDPLRVINIGLASFADDLRAEGAEVIQLDWRPPAGGNEKLSALLADMEDED